MKVNTIYNEDCFITMSKMNDDFVDIVFTSPPYNRKRNDKYLYFNDSKLNYYEFLKRFINEAIRVSKGNVYVNIMKNYYNKKDVFKLIGEYSKEICEIFIWEKTNPLPASGFAITNAYEMILVFGAKINSNKTYTKNHLSTSVAKMPNEHKAVMNPKVADFFIKNFTKENDLIYDCFSGLGTTAIACIKNNRKYIGSEIIKQYADISINKIKEL